MKTLIRCPNDGNLLRDRGDEVLQCPFCNFNLIANQTVLTGLYAWVSVDRLGREGFIACEMNGIVMALIHSNLDMVMSLEPAARKAVSTLPGYGIRLIRFTRREVIRDDTIPS